MVLWRDQALPRGEWREETRAEVAGLKIQLGSGKDAVEGGGTFAFLEVVERDLATPTRQDAQLLNSSTQGTLSFLGNAGNDIAQGSALQGKKMVGRRERDHWQFAFKDIKPSPEEQKALDAFGKRTDLLAFIPYLYGPQPRRKGETWKANADALTKDAKSLLAIDLTFTLVDVADHQGARCAHIGVSGTLSIPFGPNNGGELKLAVQGDIWRDVRDLVDVEANLRGTVQLSGIPANNRNVPEGATAQITAPFTLVRTVTKAGR